MQELTVETVLERLDSEDPKIIREALREAVSVRDELVPPLLEIVRTHEPVDDDDEARSLPYLAWYLLAQFRETRALEAIVGFYRTHGDAAENDSGDVTVQDLPRILASMWTGDLDLIGSLVLDEGANEWVRGAAVRSVVVALLNDLIPYDEAEAWLDELMATRVARAPSVVWDALFEAAVHLGSRRLLERALPLTDLSEMDDYRGEVRRALQRKPGLIRDWQTTGRYYQLVDDAVDATSWWSIFYEKGQSRVADNTRRPSSPFPENTQLPPSPAPEVLSPIRTGPKIGRNEPCPCGSGRKYKKCCG